MSAICLFGALCSVSQDLFISNRYPVGVSDGLDLIVQNSFQQHSSETRIPINSPSQSPCPSVFRYIQDNGEWKGEVTLENVDSRRDTNLRVEITINHILHDKNVGSIQLSKSIGESVNDISNNRPLIYRVNFPTQNPVPKIKGVNYNDILVCSGSRDTGHSVTTINLSHILRAGQNKRQTTFPPNYQTQAPAYQTQAPVYQTQAPTYQTERPSAYQTYQTQAPPTYQTERPSSYQTYQTKAPAYQTQAPIYQTERPSASHQTTIKQELHQQSHNNKFTTKPTLKPNNIESSAEDVACGIPVLGLTQSLVVGGKETSRGQWPWLVAFYKAGRGNLEFICGGNLISKMHVITAAHCIQNKESNKKREADTGVLYIGKHNLDNWNEQGSQKRGVQRFIVHEEWQPFETSYDADIAIIVMDSAVEYSKYIRPLCVWEFSDNLNDVVGQKGALAGWGLNDNFVLNSEFPKMIQVPIVSEGTCLRSHPVILKISSERTFCAGSKNGEGPCQGDSGGGLLLKKGDKWYLRGLVSASPSDGTSHKPCDQSSFVLFTDVAKFKIWIRLNAQ